MLRIFNFLSLGWPLIPGWALIRGKDYSIILCLGFALIQGLALIRWGRLIKALQYPNSSQQDKTYVNVKAVVSVIVISLLSAR